MAPEERRIWGWMSLDLAQQPYATLGLTFIFSPYVAAVASGLFETQGLSPEAADAQAQSLWAWSQAAAGLVIALSAPILGALADASRRRMPWILGFMVIAVPCAWSMWILRPDGENLTLALVLFWIGFIAAEAASNLNNAQLPSLAHPRRIGRISGSGAALGYWGGVVSLLVMLAFFAQSGDGPTLLGHAPLLGLDMAEQEGTRAVGPLTAIWMAICTIPFAIWMYDPPAEAHRPSWSEVWGRLGTGLRDVLRRPSLASFLLGSMLYRDALGALYSFGGIYATLMLGWTVTDIGVFGVTAAVAAAAVTWVAGLADQRWGPKPVIVVSCTTLIAVCLVVLGVTRDSVLGIPLAPGSILPDAIFYACGAIIGGAGGGLFSASRTLMARHAEENREGEAFGLFALSGRATAFLGPALVAAATEITGSVRWGLVPVILLFALGLALLAYTRPEGDRSWPASSSPFSR